MVLRKEFVMSKWTAEDIRRDAKEKNVHFIRLAFSDVNGILKNVEICRTIFLDISSFPSYNNS